MRRYEFHIAMRYLFSRERRTLASVITVVATLGVAVGVAALIAVLGVMDGAHDLLFGRMAQLFPHVQVQPRIPDSIKVPDPKILASLRSDPRVELAVPIMSRFGILQSARGLESDKEPIMIFGLDADTAKLYKTGMNSLARDQIIIGEPLARELGLEQGDKVRLMAVGSIESAGRQPIKVAKLDIVTTYSMGFNEFDMRSVFMNRERMLELYGGSSQFDYIHVKLRDPLASAAFQRGLRLPDAWVSWDWSDPQHSDTSSFFTMLTFQKYLLFLLLLLIILVAAFNIIGTLILMVNDKTREIGILRAIGADERSVARVFLFDGMLVGMLGTVAGVVLGLVVCWLIPFVPLTMPEKIYNFGKLPVTVHLGSVLLVVVSAVVICTLASLLPARHAAKLHPVEALRYD